VQRDLLLGTLQITFPLFAARDDPRYTALLRKMNFPESCASVRFEACNL
jgi:hypothetical protein